MRLALLAVAVATFATAARAADPAAGPPPRDVGPRASAAPPAVVAVANALASQVGPPPEGRRAVLLAVEARARSLAPTVETALDAALAARGYAVTPHRGTGDAEAAARATGQEWLLRVRAGLVPGTREVALVGELIPAWTSFFLQRRPGARAVPPRVVQARAPADPETLLIGEEPSGPAPFAAVRSLLVVPGRVVALAVGAVADGGEPTVVAATTDAILVLSPSRGIVARREIAAAAPVRYPATALAVGDFGGGRIAVQRAGAPRAEVLALRGDRLELAGTLEAAPLCAGGAGRLLGAFVPGTAVFADLLTPLVDREARPRSARALYGAAAAPRGGRIAFAVLGTDLRLELLGADLAPVQQRRALATGSAFALADLDGDGIAELVASSPEPGPPDRLRIFAPLSDSPLVFESALPERATLAAAAAGDLTGDGVDDAVLAMVVAPGDAPPVMAAGGEPQPYPTAHTTLLLVTRDPRVAP